MVMSLWPHVFGPPSICGQLEIVNRLSFCYVTLHFDRWWTFCHILNDFYHAMLSICGTSHGPVSLRPSQVGVLSKRMNESSCFLAWELHSTYPTQCFKEIHVPWKIRVLPSGILLQTVDLENFATAYRSSKRAINLARERWTLRAW